MKTIEYLISFRGHGQLSDSRTLAVPEGGDIAVHAKAAADCWCRSHKSPFAHYCVIAPGGDVTGLVSRDAGAPYTVVVGPHPSSTYHDFRSKKDFDGFVRLCIDKSISHTAITWLKKRPKAHA